MVIEADQIPDAIKPELEGYALGFLSHGRDWDVPHTEAVIHYASTIARSVKVDGLVIATAAVLHDIGYYALFSGSASTQYDQVMDKKADHMLNGALLAKALMDRESVGRYYKAEQKNRVVHLVSVHDRIEELNQLDELVLMEADTLGAIDVKRVTPTFDLPNAQKYIANDLLGRRVPKFKTDLGKQLFEQLFPVFQQHFGL